MTLMILLAILYLLFGILVAGLMKNEIGAHETEGAFLVVLIWPAVLVVYAIFWLLKQLGYRV